MRYYCRLIVSETSQKTVKNQSSSKECINIDWPNIDTKKGNSDNKVGGGRRDENWHFSSKREITTTP